MKIAEKIDGKKVNFWILAKPGSNVFVAGTFNGWNPKTNQLQDSSSRGHFKTVTHVPSGKHEYKFVVDGVWVADPACNERIADTFGSENSVLHV